MAVPIKYDVGRDRVRGALGAGLLLGAVIVLLVAWLVGGGWRFHDEWPFWVDLAAGGALPILAVLGVSAVSVWALFQPGAPALRVRAGTPDRAFVAPPLYLLLATQAATQLAFGVWPAGSALRLWGEGDRASRADAMFTFVVLTVFVAGSLLWIVAMFRGAGRHELRPEGLRVVNVHGRHDVPWEAVSVGLRPRSGRGNASPIGIGRPELVRSSGLTTRRPKRVWLPLHLAAVQRDFLINAINHYLLHPEHRAAIGTPEEHERLQRAMAVYAR
jgi:hypothetical protein